METKERASSVLVAAIALGLSFSGSASAQQTQTLGTYNINPTKVDERVIPGFYPGLELDVVYDDNILRTENNTIDSMILEARPELQWVGVMGKHMVRLGYQGYYGIYEESSSENFYDHYLGADATLDLTPKFNLNLTTDYRREHEPRTVAVAVLGTRPNRWEQWAVAGQAVYGRRIAKAQMALKLNHNDRRYLNNGQDFRDYKSNGATFTFYYNLGPKTQLLLEPSVTKYEYTDPASVQDNTMKRILAGVTWDATAKTTGQFKIGYHKKTFDTDLGGDTSGLSTEAKVIWKPKTYSTVTATLSRSAYDSALGGISQSFEAGIAQVDWVHELTRLTELQAGASYENDKYDQGRKDDLTGVYIGVSYALRRNLTIGARYDYTSRNSNAAGADFDDNRIAIGLKAALR